MFGTEKKRPQPFEFDLEKDLKAHPAKKKEILETADQCMNEIKAALREGKTEDFDNLGELMHGYAALQKVIGKVGK